MDFASFRTAFNKELVAFLASKSEAYRKITDEPLIIRTLDHAVQLAEHGGKRVRPYLCFLAYTTEGGTDAGVAMRAGLALELFHVFALIHDDIIDRGMTRHDLPTIHRFIAERILADGKDHDGEHAKSDAHRVGEGMAMLAGDLLFGWSEEIMAQANNDRVRRLFFEMIEQVVVGQMLDVAFMTKSIVSMEAITKKNEMKTARYSFLSPMLIGAALAGSERHTAWYTKLGLSLGQAFQIQDDLLDVIGKEATGKKPFIDIEDGQHTILSQYVFDHGTSLEQDTLRSRFGKKLGEEDRALLLELFFSTGAVAHAEKAIGDLFAEAKHTIQQSDLAQSEQATWLMLIDLLDKRAS